MAQNQNATINQFLQGKSTSNGNYIYNSVRNTSHNESHFDRKILNQTTTQRITPFLEIKGDYLISNNNKLKLSYKDNINNHSAISRAKNEYSINNNSDNFSNSTWSKKETSYYTHFKTETSPDKIQYFYYKTEDNCIRRARSGYYSNLQDPIYRKGQKTYNRKNNYEKKLVNILQSSPSQPLFYKNTINLEEKKKKIYNYSSINNFYNTKTFNNISRKNKLQPLSYKRSFDEKTLSKSINNIYFDKIKDKNKKIKNFKNNNINRSSTLNNNIMHIFVNDIDENDSNIKENYKYHSITVKTKINKEDKEEINSDYKRYYNINSSKIKMKKLNENIMNSSTKIISPKKLNNYRNYFSSGKRIDSKYILKKAQNHTILESINLSKKKENDYSDEKNTTNKKIEENKSLRGSVGKSIREIKNINIGSERRNNDKISNSSYKLESKDINLSKIINDYDSGNSNTNRYVNRTHDKKASVNNGINYIYEGRNRKQKSLIEVTKDLKDLLDGQINDSTEIINNNTVSNSINGLSNKIKSINRNRNIMKSSGNNQKRTIKKIAKNISIYSNETYNNNYTRNEIKQMNHTYLKTEEGNKNCSSHRKKEISNDFVIKKSNSINIVSEKEKEKDKDKGKKIKNINISNEICKVNNLVFYGKQANKENNKISQNNTNNRNIIIIINNSDKNKTKINSKNLQNNNIINSNNEVINNNNNSTNNNNNNNNSNTNNNINNDNSNNINNINNSNNNIENNINLNSKVIKKKSSSNEININSNNNIKNGSIKNNKNINSKHNITFRNKNNTNNIKVKKIKEIKKMNTENIKVKNDIFKNINNQNQIKKVNKNIINNNVNNNANANAEKENEIQNRIKEIKIELNVNKEKNNKENKGKEDIISNNPEDPKEPKETKELKEKINSDKIKEEKPISNTEISNIEDIKKYFITENNNNDINDKSINININPKVIESIKEDNKNDTIININNTDTNINISINSNSPSKEANNPNTTNKTETQNALKTPENSNKMESPVKQKDSATNNDIINDFKNNHNLDISKSKTNSKLEANLFNNYNNFLSKKDFDDQSSNSSQDDKKPDFNNNDFVGEEIEEIKPVIQHNIERKRPVFTIPASKKRAVSQGKPFNLIHKYYDENFILEDDAEGKFKKYIKIDGESRNNSEDNSISSYNSRNSSVHNSNKKQINSDSDKDSDKDNDINNKYSRIIMFNSNFTENNFNENINNTNEDSGAIINKNENNSNIDNNENTLKTSNDNNFLNNIIDLNKNNDDSNINKTDNNINTNTNDDNFGSTIKNNDVINEDIKTNENNKEEIINK